MTTAISEDLRARRSEIVKQHIDAENRHDPDGVVASFDRPCYDIPSLGDAGQVNGPEAVRELARAGGRVPRSAYRARTAPAQRGRRLRRGYPQRHPARRLGGNSGDGPAGQCPHRLPV